MTTERRSTASDPPRGSLAVIYCAFFLSGMASLVYQVVWSRLLTLVIGVSIFAVTTVVCTFMAGLALGSYAFGRWSRRWSNPLLVYGLVEAVIGIYAAVTPWIFDGAQPLYAWAFGRFDRIGLNAFRVVLSLLILLLPTSLMGGTLPLLSQAVSAWKAHAATGAGLLYAVNTFGAVVGCVTAGFVFLMVAGIRGSLFIAAGMNLAIAAAVVLHTLIYRPTFAPSPTGGPSSAGGGTEPPSREERLLLWVFLISGFAALGYEVLWTRALLVYLKASTYAFSVALAVYLLGIAAGSLAVSRMAGRTKQPLRAVAVCQVGIAVSVVLSMLFFPRLKQLGFMFTASNRLDSFGAAVVMMLTQASIVLLLPTLFMGAMFPFGVAAYHRGVRGLGRSVGSLYATNTVGNILGSVAVGFFAIPLIGVRHALVALVAVNLFLAAVILGARARSRLTAAMWPLAAAAAVALLHVRVSDQLFHDTIAPGARLVYYKEGASDTVAVVERAQKKDRTLVYSDGRGAAGTSTLLWNLYFGHLPMLLHPNPTHVLHICYGAGNSVLALTRHHPERIDVVELSPHVREASQYFWTNEGVVEDPLVNLIIEDGRNFLLGTDRRYDVISLEPPNIFTAGVVNLYSRDFYALARQRLKPGGVMVQWLPTIQLSLEDRGRLIRAFADVFPHTTIWQQLTSTSLLLHGSDTPIRIDVDEIERRLGTPEMQRDVASMGVRNAYGFLSYFLLGGTSVRKLVAPYEPVVDDRTVVDYSIPRFVGSGFGFNFHNYPVGAERDTALKLALTRMAEYATWGERAAEIVPDACQAQRLDRAIRQRMSTGRPGYVVADEPIPGCSEGAS